jgi:putative transposase
MSTFYFSRDTLTEEERNLDEWATVDRDVLAEEERALFDRRLGAIRFYVAGRSHNDIVQTFEIDRGEVRRLLKRCLKRHADGRLQGQRALVPGARCKTYERTAEVEVQAPGAHGGASGALHRLFEQYPDIKERVDDLFLRRIKRGEVHESRIPTRSLHKEFIKKCRSIGVKGWPFTTKWLGSRALHGYLLTLFKDPCAIAARMGDEAARRLAASHGAEDDDTNAVTRPYQRIQFDGHRIDAFFIILIRHVLGHDIPVSLPRLWVLVIQDVLSRTILGYSISLQPEYNANDVMQCIRRTVMPWQRRLLTIPGLVYPEDGGFPSEVIPELQWAVWEEHADDNALANLAGAPRTLLVDVIKSRSCAGGIKVPERRAFVERVFKTLEENGFHRLPSTTGSDPKDPRRRDPEGNALKYEIRLEHLEELLEVLIALYNGTPHTSLGFRTPLEVLRFHVAQGTPIRTLAEDKRNDLALIGHQVVRHVRGNPKQGRTPYITLEGVVYRNDVLSRSPGLIGQKLSLRVNPEDMRSVKAFLDDGAEFGVLTATGYWGRTLHTLEMRRAINQLRARRMLSYLDNQDPIMVYREYLASEAVTKKRARSKYAKTTRQMASAPDAATTDASAPTAATPAPKKPPHNVVTLAPRRAVTY